jgi:MoxR-like ATPase
MPDTPDKLVATPPWMIFGATDDKGDANEKQRTAGVLPAAPPWRSFAPKTGGKPPPYLTTPAIDRAVNAAWYLRRPLLVTGGPGTGKSSLAREVARQLRAERFLKWPINSKSTLADALYRYDAIGRLRDANLASLQQAKGPPGAPVDGAAAPADDDGHEDIGSYLSLGPLGTALVPPEDPPPGADPPGRAMRVLLIDEIDKSDLDLPNDLLDVLEDGQFTIPELKRIKKPRVTVGLDRGDRPADPASAHRTEVEAGSVRVRQDRYPFILITSNGERDFSPAFLRRCVRLELGQLDKDRAQAILAVQLGELPADVKVKVDAFVTELTGPEERSRHAVDQLLSLAWLLARGVSVDNPALLDELKGVVAGRLDE